jgi:hypothetical protein
VATKRHVQVSYYGDEFLAAIRRHGDKARMAMGTVVSRAAVRKAPRGRTGNLARSAYVATRTQSTYVKRRYWRKEKLPPEDGVTVGFSAPHAHLQESGRRRAGVITPRKRRGPRAALKLGEGIYRKSSRYRAAAAQPFLGPAIEATRETAVEEMAKILRNGLENDLP